MRKNNRTENGSQVVMVPMAYDMDKILNYLYLGQK